MLVFGSPLSRALLDYPATFAHPAAQVARHLWLSLNLRCWTTSPSAVGTELNSRITSDEGEFIVFTKASNLLFFFAARTSVMPFKVKDFAAEPGFQVRYNTTDSRVLAEWHEMLCDLIAQGLFAFLCDSARVGYFPYPDGKEHPSQHVKRFI